MSFDEYIKTLDVTCEQIRCELINKIHNEMKQVPCDIHTTFMNMNNDMKVEMQSKSPDEHVTIMDHYKEKFNEIFEDFQDTARQLKRKREEIPSIPNLEIVQLVYKQRKKDKQKSQLVDTDSDSDENYNPPLKKRKITTYKNDEEDEKYDPTEEDYLTDEEMVDVEFKKHKMHRWSKQEEKILKTLVKQFNITTRTDKSWYRLIQNLPNRSVDSCIGKARRLKLISYSSFSGIYLIDSFNLFTFLINSFIVYCILNMVSYEIVIVSCCLESE